MNIYLLGNGGKLLHYVIHELRYYNGLETSSLYHQRISRPRREAKCGELQCVPRVYSAICIKHRLRYKM